MRRAAGLCALLAAGGAQAAVPLPFADTEDATLSTVEGGDRGFVPILTLDLRNGDFARGAYDDDGAGLARLPVHVAIGAAAIVSRRADGSPSLALIGQSSNGFHAPAGQERNAPRTWYESNTIAGLAWQPANGLTAAALYAIKTSPNGIAPTSHEASLSILYAADDGIGRLKPRFAVTRRTRGDGGVYTIAGLSPEWTLAQGEDAATIALPIAVGIGWGGFYAAGSGDRAYGSAGLSLARPIRVAGARATIQAEILALVRDARLARLDAPEGRTDRVVPLATLSFRMVL
ncbi:MAG: hypothetical protein PGN09_06280 [Sphingomonas fennica]